MEGDFCSNYLLKIEFFKTRSGLSQLRKKKTPLAHLLNKTQFPFPLSTNFLKRKIYEDFPLFMDKTVFATAQEP